MESRQQAQGIAILRIVVGIVFLIHGWQKVFVMGFPRVSAFMQHLGIPLPHFFGLIVPLVELLGGLALVFGFFNGFAAALLACDMLVALIKVHLHGGFFLPAGFEYELTLLAANVALFLAGPGSLWPARRQRRETTS